MQDYQFSPFPLFVILKKIFIDRYALIKMGMFLVFPLVIFPYIEVGLDFSQPAPWGASFDSFMQFLWQMFSEFPVTKQQKDTISGLTYALLIIFVVLVLASFTKLSISAQKIQYRYLGLPIYTLVNAKDVEYSQTIEPHLDDLSTFNKLFRPHLHPIQGLFFFPLGKPPYKQLFIEVFDKDQQAQIRQLLKQYYHYRDEISVEHIAIPQPKDIHISPRIGIALACCIPIGLLGFYLASQANFIFVDNYPNFMMWISTWIVLTVIAFWWIKKDRMPLAWFGALLSGFFNATALVFLLFPICHAHYTLAFGETNIMQAEIIEKTDDRQVWQNIETKQKFYLHAHLHELDPNLKTFTTYQVTSKYHWHNHVLDENAFIQVKLKDSD